MRLLFINEYKMNKTETGEDDDDENERKCIFLTLCFQNRYSHNSQTEQLFQFRIVLGIILFFLSSVMTNFLYL